MKVKSRHSGLTLMEQTVVIAGMALLAGLSLPSVRTLLDSFESVSGTRTMISSALASARAIAAKEQRYAGIRFQKAGYHGDLASLGEDDVEGLINASQYIVFIVQDYDKTGLANGFRAVEGIEPIKLPDSIGVMDLRVRVNYDDASNNTDQSIQNDNLINEPVGLRDTTTFSIIFSPAGKLVIHNVRVRNRDEVYRPDNDGPSEKVSWDDIFNSPVNIKRNNTGVFVQDDYANLGLGEEPSRRGFVIYEKDRFKDAFARNEPYSGYLEDLEQEERIYINPYTGRMIRQ